LCDFIQNGEEAGTWLLPPLEWRNKS
jgi:hypothetical protein